MMDNELNERELLMVIEHLKDVMDERAIVNDDEAVKEIATIIRKLGGGQ